MARVLRRDTGYQGFEQGWIYDVSADGQRFLLNTVEAKPAGPITLVVNWMAAVEK